MNNQETNNNFQGNRQQGQNQQSVRENRQQPITPIRFVPDYMAGHMSTKELEAAVGKVLSTDVDGYHAVSVTIANKDKGHILVRVAIRTTSNQINESALARLGAANAYTMNKELKSKLSIFKIDPTAEFTTKLINSNGNKLLLVDLDFIAVFAVLMQKPQPGFIYKYSIAKKHTDNSGLLKIEMTKIQKGKNKSKNNRNRDNNNRHNENRATTW